MSKEKRIQQTTENTCNPYRRIRNISFTQHEKPGRMVLGQELYYDLDCFKTLRNNNVAVIGGAGTGKTRGIVEPNLLEATGSYVVADPKGNLCEKYRGYLEAKGYKVMKIDFVNPEQSIKYNMFEETIVPGDSVRSAANVTKLAKTIVAIQHNGTRELDPFWDESATLLLTALIGGLLEFCIEEEHNFSNVVKMVNLMRVNEDDPDEKTALDELFDDFEEVDPDSYVIRKFQSFRVAAGKTLRSIQITLNAMIGQFADEHIDGIMHGHDLSIPSIGNRKTALFICASDTDRTYDGLVNAIFTQIMNGLVGFADSLPERRLPIPVRFIMDDFATNVRITDFPRMISSIRSRGISTMIMLQAEAQLDQYYGKDAETILSSCDTYVYMGGNDIDTARNVAERADKTLHTILEMPVGYEWVFRRGEKPVYTQITNLDEYRSILEYPPCAAKADTQRIQEEQYRIV